MALNSYIRRIVQSIDENAQWHEPPADLLAGFAASEAAAALYVARTGDGDERALRVLPSLDAFPAGLLALMAVLKPPGVLEDMSRLSVVEIPAGADVSSFETLRGVIRSVVGPVLEASAGQTAQTSVNYAAARQKLAELELSLVNLQHHQEVQFAELPVPAVPAEAELDTAELNSLQNVVNGWKRTAQSVAATDRDVAAGSASDEVRFWQSMESALAHLQQQLDTDDVRRVLQALERGKRFHATVNFFADTGLPDALDKVHKYNVLLRDLPINEMLTATSVDAVTLALDAVFGHLSKRLRASAYPVSRCLGLVEAVSSDFGDVLRELAGPLLSLPADESERRTTALRQAFARWDDHVRDFTTLARDVIRKRAEKFIPVRVKALHAPLQERIEYIFGFRQRHGELAGTLEQITAGDRELQSLDLGGKIAGAYEQLAAIDTLDTSPAGATEWATREKAYDAAASAAETDVARVLRARLASSSSAQDMFSVFDRFNALFGRPAIRGAIQEYQALLLERVKADLVELQRRASRREAIQAAVAGQKLRDVPPLAGLVLWMAQVGARLETLLARVGLVLGADWQHYADGERLWNECEAFRAQFDPRRVVNEWVQTLANRQVAGPVLVAKRGKLSVSLDAGLGTLPREIKLLRTLRLPVPHQVLALASDVQVVSPAAVRLSEAVRAFYAVAGVRAPVRDLLVAPLNNVYGLFEQVLALQWADLLGIDDRPAAAVAALDRAVTQLQGAAQQAENTHMRVLALVADLDTCEYSGAAFGAVLKALAHETDGVPPRYATAATGMATKALAARFVSAAERFGRELAPTVHRISVRDQAVCVTPELEDTLAVHIAALGKLAEDAGAGADPAALGRAMATLIADYRAAAGYVAQWLDFQALWDLKPAVVFDALQADLGGWLQALEDVRAARSELERGGGERHFGGFVVQFGQVYWLISAKYDAWQNALVQRFGELVSTATVDFSAGLAAPRQALERLAVGDARPEAVVATLTTLANGERALNDNAVAQLGVLRQAHVALARQRFQFPPSWLYADQLRGEWDALASVLARRQREFEASRDLLQTGTLHELQRLQRHVTDLLAQWASGKPVSGSLKPADALFALDEFEKSVKRHAATRKLLAGACGAFGLAFDVPPLEDAEAEIADFVAVWKAIDQAWSELHSLEQTPWVGVTSRALRQSLKTLVLQTQEMPARVRQYAAFQHLQTVLRQRVDTSDLVQRLRAPAVLPRHWRELGAAPATLGDVWALDLFVNRARIEQVLDTAEGEARLTEYVAEVAEVWANFGLELVPFREVQLIRNWTAIFAQIDEHLQALAMMHHSPHFAAVAGVVSEWETRLAGLRSLFDVWVEVQREWVYLEGVFSAPELRQVLPTETAKFQAVNAELYAILRLVVRSPRALDVAAIPGISDSVARLSEQLHKVQRALGEYFERERQRFPRFYFVGDDDLLEMIGAPAACERHVGKMFAGIAGFVREGDRIVGVRSAEGEELRFAAPAAGDSAIDLLRDVETRTAVALRTATRAACQAVDWANLAPLFEHPGQAGLLALQLVPPPPDYAPVLASLAELSRQGGPPLIRRRVEAAITLLVHLQQSDRRLSYAWDGDDVIVEFGGARFSYGFEYHGVPDQLVRTELGDELWLTLTQALAQRQGGAPYGPAGTGKTESVKALGQALGKYVLVFCCDETFDVRAVSRLLLGICQVGAWGCFDEFNRLGTADLSAVSSQVAEIETALAAGRESVELGGRRGALSSQTGLFVTMNPNYAGRNALPENLRKQFRSFALTHPNKQRIAEVVLYAQGFADARSLAAAIVPLFDDIAAQLSSQRHYDWGLRALKNVLRICGALRADAASELAAVRQACAETIAPKLVDADLEVYAALEQAAFGGPAPALASVDVGPACAALGLDPTPRLAAKVAQLQRFFALHQGVILVGAPAAGKSTALQCLAHIQGAEVYTVDAKVMSKAELYGRLDPVTREWTDGLFTHLLRRVSENLRGEARAQHWVVFDGDVDPEWAENLNSALDDNKLLTLPSGERLQLPPSFRIVFEVADLAAATPATVSRCGIVWFGRAEEATAAATEAARLDHVMGFMPAQSAKSYAALCAAAAARSELAEYAARSRVAALTWAYAGQAPAEQRAEFAQWAAGHLGLDAPPDVLEYDVSPFSGQWMPWADAVDDVDLEPRAIIEPGLVVPTVDTVRLERLLLALLTAGQPVVLCGPPGSGKTMTLLSSLRGSETMDVVPLNFSKTTHAAQIIRTLEQHCVYVSTPDGPVLEPAAFGRRVVLFCDEINLVAPDRFGTQPPIALLRQFVEHGGFWRKKQYVRLRRIQFVGACNPPTDAGRTPLPQRFLRHCTILNVGYPAVPSLRQIYGALGGALLKCVPALRGTAAALPDAMLQVYTACAASPFASKYVYSPRELTRWTRGLYGAIKDQYSLELPGLVDVWAHEALRVFADRLRTDEQRAWTARAVAKAANAHFGVQVAPQSLLFTRWLTREYQQCERGALREFLVARMAIFAEEVVDMPLTLFDDLVDHALRIDRVLRQPQGHAILMGTPASGKTTLVRFVCWMNGMETYRLRTFASYGDADFAADLRAVLRRAVAGAVCLLLDESQMHEPAFVEKMNTLLANGEVPGLFEGDELAALTAACRSAGATGDDDDVLRWFTMRTALNLHVVFTVSLSSPLLASPALANRCVLSYMGDWSAPALLQLAEARTALLDVSQVAPGAMVAVHQCAQRRLAATPGHYIAFTTQFAKLYTAKKASMENEQRHFHVGIDRLKGTMLEVRQLRTRLAAKQQELGAKQAAAKQMLHQMLAEQSEAERKREASIEIKAAVDQQNEAIAARQAQVQADLERAEPAVRSAEQGVSNIKKQHLNELRAFTNPPEAVKITLEAVCVMLGRTPSSWREVLQQVRSDDFISSIVQFDNERQVTPAVLRTLQRYLDLPNFNYAAVNRASKACGPLLEWVLAQVAYATVLAQVDPLRREVAELEHAAREKRAQQTAITEMITELERSIEQYGTDYAALIADAQAVKHDMLSVDARITRSVDLIASLESEKTRWAESVAQFAGARQRLLGDCLVAAAVVAYAGALDQRQRLELVDEWLIQCDAHQIAFSETLNPAAYLLGTPPPGDALTAANAAILANTDRYAYVIDPSERALAILRAQRPDVVVTSFSDAAFAKHVESALRFGTAVVVTNAERFDPLVLPIVNKEYTRRGGRTLVEFGRAEIDVSPQFSLVLLTADPLAAPPAYLAARLTVVNFSVTRNSLELIALDRALAAHRPEVEATRRELALAQTEYKAELHSLEVQLLEALNQAGAEILDNQPVMDTLERVKHQAEQVAAHIAQAESAMAGLASATAEFEPVAAHAGRIFALMDALQTVNPFYQFSLDFFLRVFAAANPAPDTLPAFYAEIYRQIAPALRQTDRPALAAALVALHTDGDLSLEGAYEQAIPFARPSADVAWLDAITTADRPVLFGMAGADPTLQLKRLAEKTGADCVVIGLGSVQSAGIVDAAILRAAKLGQWLVLQNVHLDPAAMAAVAALPSVVPSAEPSFRLLVSADMAAPLPAPLLRQSRLLCVERPENVPAAVTEAIALVGTDRLAAPPAERAKVYLAVCWLHSIVVERWAHAYPFSDADLQAALWTVDQHISSTSRSNVDPATLPWGDLRDLVFTAVYAAKMDVRDDCDALRKLVDRILTVQLFDVGYQLCDEVAMPEYGDQIGAWLAALPPSHTPHWLDLADSAANDEKSRAATAATAATLVTTLGL